MLDSRTKILNAASELFLEGGLGALSVRAIASKAGLSTIGIYSHFDGKQGILDTLYIEGFERVADAMDMSSSDATPRQKVMECAKAYLEVADKFYAHYRLIFGELDDNYQPSLAAREVAEKAFSSLVKGVGSILPDEASHRDRQREALHVWAIVHGYVGLKNHAVSQIVEPHEWNVLALAAVKTHLDGSGF